MAAKMKGIYKGFKCISQIFGYFPAEVKEREMEIGYPTDVKHVAHIGWDGSSGSAPSWMSEFKVGADLSSPIGNARYSSSFALSASSSQDFDQVIGQQQTTNMFRDIPSTNLLNTPKKQKRKKKSSSSSSTSSPKCSSSSRSSRSSRSALSKSIYKSATSAHT